MKILSIEDEVSINQLYRIVFAGHEFVSAMTAEEGLGKINETYDIIILDYWMKGGVQGLDLLKAIRVRTAIPILVCTAFGPNEVKKDVFEHGGKVDLLHKPFHLEVLKYAVGKLVYLESQGE